MPATVWLAIWLAIYLVGWLPIYRSEWTFLQAGCPAWWPTSSARTLKTNSILCIEVPKYPEFLLTCLCTYCGVQTRSREGCMKQQRSFRVFIVATRTRRNSRLVSSSRRLRQPSWYRATTDDISRSDWLFCAFDCLPNLRQKSCIFDCWLRSCFRESWHRIAFFSAGLRYICKCCNCFPMMIACDSIDADCPVWIE